MTKPQPIRVDNIEQYWAEAPPVESARCRMWRERIDRGWRPNRRVSAMGYYETAKFFGVYLWEWLHVLSPLLDRLTRRDEKAAVDVSWITIGVLVWYESRPGEKHAAVVDSEPWELGGGQKVVRLVGLGEEYAKGTSRGATHVPCAATWCLTPRIEGP